VIPHVLFHAIISITKTLHKIKSSVFKNVLIVKFRDDSFLNDFGAHATLILSVTSVSDFVSLPSSKWLENLFIPQKLTKYIILEWRNSYIIPCAYKIVFNESDSSIIYYIKKSIKVRVLKVFFSKIIYGLRGFFYWFVTFMIEDRFLTTYNIWMAILKQNFSTLIDSCNGSRDEKRGNASHQSPQKKLNTKNITQFVFELCENIKDRGNPARIIKMTLFHYLFRSRIRFPKLA